MQRSGITPVIAVVLLVMIAVTLIGGVWAWTEGLVSGQQNEADQQLDTRVEYRGLNCAANGDIDITVKNTGSIDVSSSSVDVFVYNVSNDNLNGQSTGNSNFLDGTDNDGTLAVGEVATESGVSGGWVFDAGRQYRVQVDFTNQDYSVSSTCQAQ